MLLWCLVEGDSTPFPVAGASDTYIGELKDKIQEKRKNSVLSSVDASLLTLWKVDLALPQSNDKNDFIGERVEGSVELKEAGEEISDYWPATTPPARRRLHIIVQLPSAQVLGGSPVPGGARPIDSGLVGDYEDIFIYVKRWGTFEGSDISRNGLRIYDDGTLPDFVTEFEQKLDSEPGLAHDAYKLFQCIHNETRDAYFGRLKRRTVEDVSPEELTFESESENGSQRLAGYLEVLHLSYVAVSNWEQFWVGKLGWTLQEPSMNGIFFHYFAMNVPKTSTTTTVLTNQSWPINLIMKCETNQNNQKKDELRKFQPRNDLLVSKSSLPRLLVEVNSKPKKEWSEDLVRMLLIGAAIVRFANGFLDAFMEAKDFVLFAMYIWDNGRVTRYSLFQEPNDTEVRYKETFYQLNDSVGRAIFVRQLYNLQHVLESEESEDTQAKIRQLQDKINQYDKVFPMKSFHTKDTLGTNSTQGNKRKRDSNVGAGGVGDCAELGAHDYVVEQPVIGGEFGIPIGRYSKMPSHVLTVYQRSFPRKKFIAKKILEESNELKFLELLNTFQPKYEHIISLRESFQTQSTSWAILPKMTCVANCELYGKVAQVCWGVIEGVAYLHKSCIAHRDIKPENLVVDGEFCLKIIDFDFAMQVENEHEKVDGQCGTEGWMAPEIVEKSMYSPIKADRWSTGKVLLYLLNNNSRGEEGVLSATARKLSAYNPEQRSSVLQVTASHSDVVMKVLVKSKATRSLQDTVEIDENAKLRRVKKRKLSAPNREVLGIGGR